MSSLRDQAARLRMELNPLMTSLHGSQQPLPHQTPNSALSTNSLSAPFGYHPASYTPVTPAGRYNPQQWVNSPSVPSDAGTHFLAARPQDLEGISATSLVRITDCTMHLFIFMIPQSGQKLTRIYRSGSRSTAILSST